MTEDDEQRAFLLRTRNQHLLFNQMLRNAQLAGVARKRRSREAWAVSQRMQQQMAANHQRWLRLDRIVGVLRPDLRQKLGISTEQGDLRLAFSARVHIEVQRKRGGKDDREFVARYVERALGNVLLVEPLPQASHFRFVCSLQDVGRLLAVVVKFVPAARARRGEDEWWIATAYPFSAADLRRVERHANVVRLVEQG